MAITTQKKISENRSKTLQVSAIKLCTNCLQNCLGHVQSVDPKIFLYNIRVNVNIFYLLRLVRAMQNFIFRCLIFIYTLQLNYICVFLFSKQNNFWMIKLLDKNVFWTIIANVFWTIIYYVLKCILDNDWIAKEQCGLQNIACFLI